MFLPQIGADAGDRFRVFGVLGSHPFRTKSPAIKNITTKNTKSTKRVRLTDVKRKPSEHAEKCPQGNETA
jgi:hypothetical protein